MNCVYDVETPQWDYHTNIEGWINGGLDVDISCLDTDSAERSAQQTVGKNLQTIEFSEKGTKITSKNHIQSTIKYITLLSPYTKYSYNCSATHFDFRFWKHLVNVLTDQNFIPGILSFLQWFYFLRVCCNKHIKMKFSVLDNF